ncbi:MAG: sulfotransferase [Chromatiales bacterium]|nr:sulfotransferase [Chromatiales bacterium]
MGLESKRLLEARTLWQDGQFTAARMTLEQFLVEHPDDPDGLQLLGAQLLALAEYAESSRRYERLAALRPDDPAVHGNLANALLLDGRFDDAASAYSRTLALAPDHPQALNGLAEAELGRNQAERALALARRACTAAPNHAPFQYTLGRAFEALEQSRNAEAAYRSAIGLAPNLAQARVNLAVGLMDRHQYREAADQLIEAVRANPALEPAHFNLGRALFYLQRLEPALAAFDAALDLAPRHADTLAMKATVLEHLNRPDMARLAAEQALEIEPSNAQATLTLARCLKRSEDGLEPAADLLSTWVDLHPDETDATAGSIRLELATILDRLGDEQNAWAMASAGNTMIADVTKVRTTEYAEHLAAYARAFPPERLSDWPQPDSSETANEPVFIVGFPRSGTTLLDNLLRGHPGLTVLEETDLVATLEQRLRLRAGQFPVNVLELDRTELATLRELWFERAREHARGPIARVVDKLPLNLVAVPLIARVFPHARFVLVLRHPFDAVLSGFFQDFEPIPAMAYFFGIEAAAQLYETVFTLWERYRAHLPLAIHEIRYESLVSDPEATMRELIGYLGLDWDARILEHEQHSGRGINTPSYHQVAQPIYDRAVERWRRYREQIPAAVLEQLRPFATQFGYSAD